MAVSLEAFPPGKRRAIGGSFVSVNFFDHKLIQSLTDLSQEISSLSPLRFLLKRNTTSLIRKSKLLSVLFEEIRDRNLRAQVLEMLDNIKKEISPDNLKLSQMFDGLNLSDAK